MLSGVKTGKIKKGHHLDFRQYPLGDPAETRTLDPLIKSQLLYQLSYGVKKFSNSLFQLRTLPTRSGCSTN